MHGLVLAMTALFLPQSSYDLCGTHAGPPQPYQLPCGTTEDKAAVFEAASGQYLSMSNAAAVDLNPRTNDVTIWQRLKRTSAFAFDYAFGAGANGVPGIAVSQGQTWDVCCAADTTRFSDAGPALTFDAWQSHGVVLDRTADTFEAFTNGVGSGSAADVSLLTADINSTSNFVIGAYVNGSSSVTGSVSIHAEWVGTPLSDAQMATLHSSVFFCSDIAAQGLPAPTVCYPFDTDVTTPAIGDETLSNNNDVTLGQGPS